MGSRSFLLALAFSATAEAALGQAIPASERLQVRSDDVYNKAFTPFPLAGRSYLNWSDLPFTISVAELTGYNDNILGLSQGSSQPQGTPSRGDFFANTVLGASTKMYLGRQQFFADATYGWTRYLRDTADNAVQYSLDAGVNFIVTSRCAGRAIAAKSQYQTPVNQQVGSGLNTVLSKSVSETATCLLGADGGLILDSGWSSMQNTGGANALNDTDSVYVRSGLQYSVTGLDTARAMVTDTKRTFTNRGPQLAAAGLATRTEQIDYQLFYNRVLGPKLTFDGMIGVSRFSVSSAISAMASPTQSALVYSASLAWQATPKLSFGFADSRSVGAPTNTVSNVEIETSRSVTAAYTLSPKTSLQLGVSRTTSSGGIASDAASPASDGSGLASFCTLTYLPSPFLTATASYQFTKSTNGGLAAKDNIYMIGLSYTPH